MKAAQFSWLVPAEDPGLAGVRAGCLAAIERLPPLLAESGKRLLARLATANWLLEWNLPRWLGSAWGAAPESIQALGCAGVLGLATIHLQDDLADGETEGEPYSLAMLAAALFEFSILEYAALFAGISPFWCRLEACLGDWRHAILEKRGPTGADLRAGDGAAVLRLARRGAPLHVSAAASCLVSGREAYLPDLDAGLDLMLAGAVLVDHAQDWAADLAAGRYNAFVAWLSPRPQEPEETEANRRAVLAELWQGQAGQSYFDLVQGLFTAARQKVSVLGCPELDRYLHWIESEAASCPGRMAAHAQSWLEAAAKEMLGTGAAAQRP